MKSVPRRRARFSAITATLTAASLLSYPASAEQRRDPGVIVRHSEIKPMPSIESETIAMLAMGSRVGVAELRGPWIRVYIPTESNGWVQMRNLRLSATESNGLTSTKSWLRQVTGAVARFGTSSSEQSSSSQTGIRGLRPEDLASASPNDQERKKLDHFQVSSKTAIRRARDMRLSSRKLAYLNGDANSDVAAGSASRGKD